MFSSFLPRRNIKNDFFFLQMVLRKCCTKVNYHYRAKEAIPYDAVRAGEYKIGLQRETCEYFDSSLYSFSRQEIKLTLRILRDLLQDCNCQNTHRGF